MAEWSMAAVLKTVDRKVRGFESCSLRQFLCTERWLSGRKRSPAKRLYALKGVPRVQIPLSPPIFKIILRPWLSWIERQTTNLDVASSNLAGRTKYQGVRDFSLTPYFCSERFVKDFFTVNTLFTKQLSNVT